MTVPIIHVDTFVEKGLRGNAAAVCVLPGPAGIIVDAIDRAQDEHVGNGFLRPEIRRLQPPLV
jgi:hypothetical protein